MRTPNGEISSGFAFVHALHREVIYQQIPRAEAAQMHLRLAQWLTRVHGSDSHRIAEHLASHYERGGDFMQAIMHLRAAAARSLERSAPANAVELISRALRLLVSAKEGNDDPTGILLHIELARALSQIRGVEPSEIEASFEKACALAELAPEGPMQVLVLTGAAYLYFVRARFAKAEELSRRALAIADRMQVPAVSFHAQASLATVLRRTGGLVEARSLFERALEVDGSLIREMRPDMRTASLCAYSQTLLMLGFPNEARSASNTAVERAKAGGFVYDRAWALFNAAELAMYLGERAEAASHAQAVTQLADAHDFPFWSTAAHGILGWVQVCNGELETGLAAARSGAALCQEYGLSMQYGVSLLHLADCLLAAKQYNECELVVVSGLEWVEATDDRMVEPEFWRLRAEALHQSRTGAEKEIAQYLERAIESARRQGAKWWESRALASMVAIASPPPRAADTM